MAKTAKDVRRTSRVGKFDSQNNRNEITCGLIIGEGRRTRDEVDAQIDRLMSKNQRVLDALAKL